MVGATVLNNAEEQRENNTVQGIRNIKSICAYVCKYVKQTEVLKILNRDIKKKGI
jgi:hypothetical protein